MSELLSDADWLQKLKQLENLAATEVTPPDEAALAFAVCTDGVDACGWGGWLLDGASAANGTGHPVPTVGFSVPTVTNQICPRCGKTLFRTAVSHRFTRTTPA